LAAVFGATHFGYLFVCKNSMRSVRFFTSMTAWQRIWPQISWSLSNSQSSKIFQWWSSHHSAWQSLV
jgi:hypothetical protein